MFKISSVRSYSCGVYVEKRKVLLLLPEERLYRQNLPRVFEKEKRPAAYSIDWDDYASIHSKEGSIGNFPTVFDYIVDHVVDDERSYLKVDVYGKALLDFLQSGASRTIPDGRSLAVSQDVGLDLGTSKIATYTVTNSNRGQSIVEFQLPFSLEYNFFL